MAETAFRSDESFSQPAFWEWVSARPRSDINHYELLNARIVMTPPAGWPHGRLAATLVRRFDELVTSAQLGIVMGSSAGFDLPSGDTVEPDASFISKERFAAGPPPQRGKFLSIVPNLVVEILSPATTRHDRTEKKDIYERNGVDEYWLVDPDRREVSVYTLRFEKYDAGSVFRNGEIASTILAGLALTIDVLFAL